MFDLNGRPVANAVVRIIDSGLNESTRHGPRPLRLERAIHFAGLPHEARAVVDIIAANVSLGAMVEIPAVATAGAGKKEIDVRLGSLVKLSGRVLDGAGKRFPRRWSPVP